MTPRRRNANAEFAQQKPAPKGALEQVVDGILSAFVRIGVWLGGLF
ncbi:MAG: hypothetical protein Q8P02_05380 [Candidatus Micrarchaeota archaeon]|nr:hypothetical protein [Candidatus Micrarchaeota archaeon]